MEYYIMEYILSESSNCINFNFEKPIYNNIKSIYFKPNLTIKYLNKSHISYYSEITKNNDTLKFNGYFKDNYFIIFIDCYDKNLNISIYKKNVIITKLDWDIKKYNDSISLWTIQKNSKKYKYFNLNIRDFLENNNDICIDDILLINKCICYNLALFSENNFFNNKILSLFN